MSKSLALLSGKGGSGKTSLALSITSLLDKCGLKVLLVDCDLSTNGATYFYEERIDSKAQELCSFFSYFSGQEDDDYMNTSERRHSRIKESIYLNEYIPAGRTYVKISENVDFIPSVVKITKNSIYYRYSTSDRKIMNSLDSYWRQKYDVIIYDCQAGYSNILKTILPFVDTNLLVMEADTISSASIRSLFLKIGDLVNDNKLYQVFNKVSEKEYDGLNHFTDGIIFTSIERVLFDWQIREDFAVSQIPDLSNTSAHYGQQVFNICKILFKEEKIQKALVKFEDLIRLNDLKEQELQLKEKLEIMDAERIKKRTELLKRFYWIAIPIFLIFTFLLLYSGLLHGIYNTFFTIVLICFYLVAFVGFIGFWIAERTRETKNKRLAENRLYQTLAKTKLKRLELESIIAHRNDSTEQDLKKENKGK